MGVAAVESQGDARIENCLWVSVCIYQETKGSCSQETVTSNLLRFSEVHLSRLFRAMEDLELRDDDYPVLESIEVAVLPQSKELEDLECAQPEDKPQLCEASGFGMLDCCGIAHTMPANCSAPPPQPIVLAYPDVDDTPDILCEMSRGCVNANASLLGVRETPAVPPMLCEMSRDCGDANASLR